MARRVRPALLAIRTIICKWRTARKRVRGLRHTQSLIAKYLVIYSHKPGFFIPEKFLQHGLTSVPSGCFQDGLRAR